MLDKWVSFIFIWRNFCLAPIESKLSISIDMHMHMRACIHPVCTTHHRRSHLTPHPHTPMVLRHPFPQYICRAFAICLHYFFLSTFQWLLNEAFNLYIVITYAAHSHTEQTDGGSLYRYYVLGWG